MFDSLMAGGIPFLDVATYVFVEIEFAPLECGTESRLVCVVKLPRLGSTLSIAVSFSTPVSHSFIALFTLFTLRLIFLLSSELHVHVSFGLVLS